MRGTGVKLQTTRTGAPPSLGLRRKAITLASWSLQSIHSKPSRREIDLVQRRLVAVAAVEVGDPALHALVLGHVGDPPFELVVVRPFAPLAELAAHEQQLLAGMPPHVAVQRAQVGELLPVVARHLADQRALAVHHFVVRQRQDEVLVEGVPEQKVSWSW